MKWVGLFALLAAIPLMVGWLQANPRKAHLLSGLLGLLIFLYAPYNLAVAPYSWPTWSGYVKGLEFTALDAVAIAILGSSRQRSYRKPFQWQMAIYLAAVLFAVTQSAVPVVSTFYLWQLLRMYLVFRAVALVAQDEKHLYALISGLILGVAFQATLAGWARVRGMAQSGGSMGHQNLLGMLTNMVLMPSIAMALAGIRMRWALLAIGACAIALVATASRASIGIGAMGVGLVVLLTLIRRPSARKWGMTAMMGVAMAVAAPLAMNSLSSRFGESNISFSMDTDEVRTRMETAAEMMIADHPLGVGPNYFAVTANIGGYWTKAGVPATRGNRAAHVHNSYLLVRAETGFFGLCAIVLLLASAILYPLLVAFRNRSDIRGDVLVGLSASFVTFAVHNQVEWGVVTDNIQYILMVVLGLTAGLCRNILVTASLVKAERQRARRAAKRLVSQPETV